MKLFRKIDIIRMILYVIVYYIGIVGTSDVKTYVVGLSFCILSLIALFTRFKWISLGFISISFYAGFNEYSEKSYITALCLWTVAIIVSIVIVILNISAAKKGTLKRTSFEFICEYLPQVLWAVIALVATLIVAFSGNYSDDTGLISLFLLCYLLYFRNKSIKQHDFYDDSYKNYDKYPDKAERVFLATSAYKIRKNLNNHSGPLPLKLSAKEFDSFIQAVNNGNYTVHKLEVTSKFIDEDYSYGEVSETHYVFLNEKKYLVPQHTYTKVSVGDTVYSFLICKKGFMALKNGKEYKELAVYGRSS